MRAMLTNDDGIDAPGIVSLHKALTEQPLTGASGDAVELFPVAPLTVQSATSHGVTFNTPLMTRRVEPRPGMRGVAVDGRPADCVKLGIASIWPEKFGEGEKPELVISGMNAGANCGVNVIYSGTVAAAIEAAFLGVPSIAVSLHLGRGRTLYGHAARRARAAIQRVLETGLLAPHTCININIPRTETFDDASPEAKLAEGMVSAEPAGTTMSQGPDTEPDDPERMPDIVVCPMNVHGLVDRYDRRAAPSGEPYFWASGNGLDFHALDDGTDVERLFARCTTITPLSYDLTDHNAMARWAGALGG